MAEQSRFLVSVDAVIQAPRQRVFDIVADPRRHPSFDGSATVRASRADVPDRLGLGARFSMDMRMGVKYRVTNTVVEFDEPNVIAWRHFNGHIWRYRFDDVELGSDVPGGAEASDRATRATGAAGATGATRVTEEWDARRVGNRWLLWLIGFPRRNRRGMTATLPRLADLAERAEPDAS